MVIKFKDSLSVDEHEQVRPAQFVSIWPSIFSCKSSYSPDPEAPAVSEEHEVKIEEIPERLSHFGDIVLDGVIGVVIDKFFGELTVSRCDQYR